MNTLTILIYVMKKKENLNTLEPSVLFANKDNFEEFKKIVYKGNDINKRTYEDLKKFMIGNKTEWSIRVYESATKINYPEYIKEAITKNHE